LTTQSTTITNETHSTAEGTVTKCRLHYVYKAFLLKKKNVYMSLCNTKTEKN